MKRIAVVLIVMLSLALSNAFSQEISYEIKVVYKNQTPGTADISIKVTKGTPSFAFYLMTNDPRNGDVIRESGPVEKRSFTFESVEVGKYLIKIVDKNGMVAGKTVEIVSGNN
jgi:hypothetical protein